MKKVLSIILAIVISMSTMLSLAACGSKPIELTKDNIEEYLSFSTEISDKNVDEKKSAPLGFPMTTYTGEATEDIKIANKNGAKFQDVTIKLMLTIDTELTDKGEVYGWEYTSGNNQNFTGSRLDSYNYKTIDIELSNDGNYSSTEKLTLEIYKPSEVGIFCNPKKYGILASSKIVEVSGTAVK